MGSKTNKPHNGLIFKYKIMTIIHTKTIPNLPSPNENVERKINFYGFNIDGYEDTATTPDIEETINNPDYIDNETLASIPEFLVAPAFSYFVEIFHAQPEIFWTFLGMYIDENYGEGWYGTQSRKVINKR